MITACVNSPVVKCRYCWASLWCGKEEIPRTTTLERYDITQALYTIALARSIEWFKKLGMIKDGIDIRSLRPCRWQR